MASASNRFRERYRQALTTYISGSPEDAERADAFGVGRAALDENRGLVDLLGIHQSVLVDLIRELPRATPFSQIAVIAKAAEFLTQVAAPFEMTHLGWREAVDQLRGLNQSLARQVAERTAALRDSERRFQDIAEVSGDWMWETDREHRFTRLFGERIDGLPVRPEGMIGRTRWEAAGADLGSDQLWVHHKADLEARRPFRRFRYEICLPTGAPMFISASGKPVFDQDGDFIGYRGTATDETATVEAQRRAKAADALLRDAIESISGGFVITDLEDRLVLFNQRPRRFSHDRPPRDAGLPDGSY